MKMHHKHWQTYWITAAVCFACACGQIYSVIFNGNVNFALLFYLLAAGWLGLAVREIYWYYKDKKADENDR